MTLTTAGKNWLATNAGVSSCFSASGVSFVDADGVPFTAGTKDVVITFIGAHMGLKPDVPIIAGTSYNGFKAINGGSDLAFPDATWVGDRDGHPGALETQYCAPVAHVTSATLTVDKTQCQALCTVTGTVSWTNTGSIASAPTNLQVTVTGQTPITVATGITINAGETTQIYSFSIPNLPVGTYSICTSPGTHCQTLTVNVSVFAIFTSIPSGAAIYMDNSNISSGTTPYTVTDLTLGNHDYKLTHVNCTDATGSFIATEGVNTVDVRFASTVKFESAPDGARIWIEDVDGIMTDTGVDTPGIVPTTTGTHAYKLTRAGEADKVGTVTITDCKQVNVTPGGGGMGPLMMGGLLMGMMLLGKKDDDKKKTRESPTKGSQIRESPTKGSQLTLIPGPKKVSRSNIGNN